MGVNTNHHTHNHLPFLSTTETAAGKPDSGIVLSPLSSHATVEDTNRQATRYKANPTGDRHLESQPVSTLDATGNTPQHAPSINQAHIERYRLAHLPALGWVRRCHAGSYPLAEGPKVPSGGVHDGPILR